MDTLNTLGDQCFHAEIHRTHGRMFATRPLPVTLPRDNHIGESRITVTAGVLVEFGIGALEHVLRIHGDVGTILQSLPSRHDMVCRNPVTDLNRGNTIQLLLHRFAGRHLPDVRSTDNLRLAIEEEAVVDLERDGILHRIGQIHRARIGENARQRGGSSGLRTHQINLRGLRSATPLEITIAGTKADRIRSRRHVVADTETAGILQQTDTRREEIQQQAFLRKHLYDLPRTTRDADFRVRRDFLAAQHQCDGLEVTVRGIRAGADQNLIDLLAQKLGQRFHVAGIVRTGNHRFQFRKVDLQLRVVGRTVVRLQLHPVLLASLRTKKRLGHLIARKDGSGHPQFRAHIGDRGTCGNIQRSNARSCIFEDLADISLRSENLQDLQDYVLCGNARL